MFVFTSDHGDYLGDHWMGEKELFHDASSRIPMIVVDPSPEAATSTRACAVTARLRLDPAPVSPHQGGVALGCPIGSSGAIILPRLPRLTCDPRRIGGGRGVATICNRAGQGIAVMGGTAAR